MQGHSYQRQKILKGFRFSLNVGIRHILEFLLAFLETVPHNLEEVVMDCLPQGAKGSQSKHQGAIAPKQCD